MQPICKMHDALSKWYFVLVSLMMNVAGAINQLEEEGSEAISASAINHEEFWWEAERVLLVPSPVICPRVGRSSGGTIARLMKEWREEPP